MTLSLLKQYFNINIGSCQPIEDGGSFYTLKNESNCIFISYYPDFEKFDIDEALLTIYIDKELSLSTFGTMDECLEMATKHLSKL